MAFSTGGGSRRLMSEINVTPFVDVMLVLLIIFMVAAPMMTQGVQVDLPEVNAPPINTEQEPLIISIVGDGTVYLNDFAVNLENFEEQLAAIAENRPNTAVLLRADQGITYGLVVKVMAAIRAAGVTNIGMETEPELPEAKK